MHLQSAVVRPHALRSAIAFCLPFALYLRTLAPTVYNLDSAELTTAAATGGLVRATGYPLYLALGRLWTELPLGDVGFRMNLLSAFAGATTLLLADRILQRLGVRGLPAFSALGLLAAAPAFWTMSVVAEVYTLHTALMAGLTLTLMHWATAPASTLRAAVAGVVFGLMCTHHAATVLLVPGVAAFVLLGPWRAAGWRGAAASGAGFLLGLLPILYLPLSFAAAPAFNYAGRYDAAGAFHPLDLSRLAGILWLMSGRTFESSIAGTTVAQLIDGLRQLAVLLNRSMLGVALGPGVLGALWLLHANTSRGGEPQPTNHDMRRPLGVMLTLFAAANGVFFAAYRVIDVETMVLPIYLVWALWAAVGYQRLLEWVDQSPARAHAWARGLLAGSMAAAVAVALALTWPEADRSGDRSGRTAGEAVLAAAAPDALVIGWWDTIPSVQYLQLVEGARPDVDALNRFLISDADLSALVLREVSLRPVYIDSVPAALAGRLNAEPAGEMTRVTLTREVPAP